MAEIDIKKEYKTPRGVYVLFGEEDYLKRFYAGKIRETVVGDSPYALFNHVLFTPKNFTADAAADAIATPPVGMEQKLIELSEFNFSEMKAAQTEELLDFLESAASYDYAVVLLLLADGALDYGTARSGKITKPSALYKKLNAAAKTAYLARASARELSVWAGKHFTKDKIIANAAEISYLISLCGSDMMTLTSEIEKLCVYLHAKGRDTLTRADIDLVACETRELEPFALSNAVLAGKTDQALGILHLMEQKHVRPVIAFSGIYSTYIDLYRVKACMDGGMMLPDLAKKLKMNEYRAGLYASAARGSSLARISRVLELCREEDLAIKSESSDYGRLEVLICRAARR